MDATPEPDDLAWRVADIGEAFVLAWTAMPPDLPERISASQLRVLLTVRSLGRPTLSELADRLDALPSSATRLCDRLVSAGYLVRNADPANRRFHVMEVGPAGLELLSRIDQHRAVLLAGYLRAMPETTRRHLDRGLRAFADAVEVRRDQEEGVPASVTGMGGTMRALGFSALRRPSR